MAEAPEATSAASARPVVVGVDGSDPASRALWWAAEEARLRGSPIHLVHAWLWPLFHVPLGPPAGGGEGAGLRVQAEQVLADARREVSAAAPGLAVETSLVTGDAAATLLRFSADAELVVTGDRGLGGFSGLLLGSVGVHVAAHAQSPVAIVRGEVAAAGDTDPVVVGVDGSPRSQAALELAFVEAELRGAPLLAVHAWRFPTASGDDVPWGFDVVGAEKQEREVLDASVDPWAARYPGVQVARRLVPGSASAAVVAASAGARLLVLGSRGRGAVKGLLLGSTSHAAIHHAHCPVLVMRDGT